MSLRCSLLMVLVATRCFLGTAVVAQDESYVPGIVIKPSGEQQVNGYSESWALIIGINYEGVPAEAKNLVPALSNAERDAKELKKTLVQLYGYEENHVFLLIGQQASKKAIEDCLNDLKAKSKRDHSVLVFFSGHGATMDNLANERGVIYAGDVTATPDGGRKGGYLRMHLDLLNMFKDEIPAKHKLLILDCCHSGQIFKIQTDAPGGAAEDRTTRQLWQANDSLQAIASCRDRQRASDGSGLNSPFTKALLQALRRIPAREGAEVQKRSPFGVNALFADMAPELKNLPDGQEPVIRSLGKEDGEFYFAPAATDEANREFVSNCTNANDFLMLQAMVPGKRGGWWFDEVPWFIPSLRLQILERSPKLRSGVQSSVIGTEVLRDLATTFCENLKAEVNTIKEGVTKGEETEKKLMSTKLKRLELRLRHLSDLLSTNAKSSSHLRPVVEAIVSDFEKMDPFEKQHLEASDLHLLAVAKHYLQRKSEETSEVEAVRAAYVEALNKFDVTQAKELALKSLCHADYGSFLLNVKRDYPNAGAQFRLALSLFGSDLSVAASAASSTPAQTDVDVAKGDPTLIEAVTQIDGTRSGSPRIIAGRVPPPFRVFVLCSEAKAWEQQDRWGKVNELLMEAKYVAESFDEGHELMVSVLNQIGWAQVVQWRIDEGEKYFGLANDKLLKLVHSTDAPPSKPIENKPTEPARDATPSTVSSREKDFEAVLAFDSNALSLYLQHRHGLALARRLRNQTAEAISDYREIVFMVAAALEHLKLDASRKSATADAETRLLERLVNSQERLADCNLFGDSASRDLQEAADDYRRALNACDFLAPGDGRDTQRLKSLYKLSLALSLPTAAQDIELATGYCQEAKELRKQMMFRSSDPEGTLGLLSEAIVAVFAAPEKSTAETEALNGLRRQIRTLCDELRGNRRLDQLEVLLLAAKVLVDRIPDADRFHLGEDSERLLYLCRRILPKPASTSDAEPLRPETGAYLRTYYDTVMRNKLRMKPKHVKDLLEIQWEATRSELYIKPREPRPVLVLYLVDDQCHLLLDVPGGASKHCCLEGDYYVKALTRACEGRAECLPLPSGIQQELIMLKARKQTAASVHTAADSETSDENAVTDSQTQAPIALQLRWADPLRGLFESPLFPSTYSTPGLSASKGPRSDAQPDDATSVIAFKKVASPSPSRSIPRFPFVLPEGIIAQEVSAP